MKLIISIVLIMLLTSCGPHLKINEEGKIVGKYHQNKTIQQIEFYPDGRVKKIQYWKYRPKNAGWVIDF